jgi:phosphatidylinositol-3-phosphatase
MNNRPLQCLLAIAFAGASLVPGAALAQNRRGAPPIRHVFVIVLENTGFDTTFHEGSRAPYLADSLPARGALLRQYYGIGHVSLDNYIAMISGLAPTRETQIDCPRFIEFTDTAKARDGQPSGSGCVYPERIQTVANQLEAKRFTWKAYMEDMGANPARESATCGHPIIGYIDSTQRATPDDQYAAKHNPFVYFHSIIDHPACHANVVELSALEKNLQSVQATANYTFISPNLCHDGHDHPCRNGELGGLESANTFLETWVPRITSSPAFRDGLLIITFDEAPSIDASSCCSEATGPNTLRPGINGLGGGRVGAVMISPFIKPGTMSDAPYNHYAFLKSVEDIFGLSYLGYASQKGLSTFGRDVYTQPKGK